MNPRLPIIAAPPSGSVRGALLLFAPAIGLFLAAELSACRAASERQNEDQALSGSQGTGGAPLSLDVGASVGGSTTGGPPCEGDHTSIDEDGDGWTGAEGDCNDCAAQMNPGAQEYPDNGADEDCNGSVDDVHGCDGTLAVDSADPIDAARALGICRMQIGDAWGVVSAAYVTPDGAPLPNPLGHGLLHAFGPNVSPREGERMLALSSGSARAPGEPGYHHPGGYVKGYTSGAPPGYPKESPACPGVVTGEPHDGVGLKISIRAPTNAQSFRFDLNFYTFEFPDFMCSTYNDFFVAMLDPSLEGEADGNISYDELGNPISVNAAFLRVCHPQTASGRFFPCPLGPAGLAGTGFDAGDNSAATGWLQTTAPVTAPGETITLLFTVWDSADPLLDSTVLVDDFRFEVEPATQPDTIPR